MDLKWTRYADELEVASCYAVACYAVEIEDAAHYSDSIKFNFRNLLALMKKVQFLLRSLPITLDWKSKIATLDHHQKGRNWTSCKLILTCRMNLKRETASKVCARIHLTLGCRVKINGGSMHSKLICRA